MFDRSFLFSYEESLEILLKRLSEPAPARIQLLVGPRQVGKTTLLLELERRFSNLAFYIALDSPEALLPGFWERMWHEIEKRANQNVIIVLIDEIQTFPNWSSLLKAQWDRISRLKLTIHIVATGSSSLRLGVHSKESLAGRFERLTLTHWQPSFFAKVFNLSEKDTIDIFIRMGAYPGAFRYINDFPRWKAYVRDAIIETAIGRDILDIANVRKPALLKQVFAICMSIPAQVISLQKIVGQLQEDGAIETVSYYLSLLEEAFLIASIPKYSKHEMRRRSSPPKIVVLSNALLAATTSNIDILNDLASYGMWVENALLAKAYNCGQIVYYWREEPYEVDAITEGSWGKWAIEIKTGKVHSQDLNGLFEFTKRHPSFRPLVLCDSEVVSQIERMQIKAISWQKFLLYGLEVE